MSSSTGCDLYSLLSGSPVLAAHFALGADGTVTAQVVDASTADFVKGLMAGVGSRDLRRKVEPSEGAVFLDALRAELGTASYWSVVEPGVQPAAGGAAAPKLWKPPQRAPERDDRSL
jgi:hypothetical protein